jgi:hypothetical protein
MEYEIYNLPNSLTHLQLGRRFNQKIFNLPLKITQINIINCYFKELIKEKSKIIFLLLHLLTRLNNLVIYFLPIFIV